MSTNPFERITSRPLSIIIASRSCITRRNLCINLLTNVIEQNKLAGTQKRSNASSNEFFTLLKPSIPTLVLLPAKDLFTKFMKMFMEITQAQVLAEPQKRTLKAKTPEIY